MEIAPGPEQPRESETAVEISTRISGSARGREGVGCPEIEVEAPVLGTGLHGGQARRHHRKKNGPAPPVFRDTPSKRHPESEDIRFR
jgi:hypothetical protein